MVYDDWYLDEDGNKLFVGHTGYMNFFPFFLGGIDPSEDRFETVFKSLIAEETGVWTDYGIRSLSKYDPYYRMGDNYWTSPIWMNLNFLIVTALNTYSKDQTIAEPLSTSITQAYQSLRMNLVNMVVDSYTSTGYIWEVYNDDSGAGMDNHPFTGWSALVTNLMAEMF
jgi:mannosyl-oligosaccharide glucosidase